MRLITVFYWMLKFLKYLGFFDDEKNTLLFYTLEVIPYAEVMFFYASCFIFPSLGTVRFTCRKVKIF